jgi:hypothetical protein
MENIIRRTTSMTFGPVKFWVDSMKGLSFALMTSSWKEDTLFGVSVNACIVGVDAMGAVVEVVIVGAAGGGGGSGGSGCDEGELYSGSPGITGFG